MLNRTQFLRVPLLILTWMLALGFSSPDAAAQNTRERFTVHVKCPKPPQGNGQIDHRHKVVVTIKKDNEDPITVTKYFAIGTTSKAIAKGIATSMDKKGATGTQAVETDDTSKDPFNTEDVELPDGWEVCSVQVWKWRPRKEGGWKDKGRGDHLEIDPRKDLPKDPLIHSGVAFEVLEWDGDVLGLTCSFVARWDNGVSFEHHFRQEFQSGDVTEALWTLADDLAALGIPALVVGDHRLEVYLHSFGAAEAYCTFQVCDWLQSYENPDEIPDPPIDEDEVGVWTTTQYLIEYL